MSGDHNMYCSGNQPDLIDRLRETCAEIVKDTLPRWKNVDEYLNDAANEIERLREQLAASRAREAKLRGLVTTLWDLLDDIDTASDMAKSDDKLYRGIVDQTQRKRWATGITSDGYTLTLPVANDDTALKEYKKQVLLEAANKLSNDWRYAHGDPADAIRSMAEEE